MIFREYTSADREACLAIFDSNAERFFSPGDRQDFAQFLDSPPGLFGVLVDDAGSVVGCGGIGVRSEGIAVLTWGMIHAGHHRHGLGKELARARLARLATMAGITRVVLHTSRETAGFYQKLGFQVAEHIRDGYRPGLDRLRLEMDVDLASLT